MLDGGRSSGSTLRQLITVVFSVSQSSGVMIVGESAGTITSRSRVMSRVFSSNTTNVKSLLVAALCGSHGDLTGDLAGIVMPNASSSKRPTAQTSDCGPILQEEDGRREDGQVMKGEKEDRQRQSSREKTA